MTANVLGALLTIAQDVSASYGVSCPVVMVRERGPFRRDDTARVGCIPGSHRSSSGVTTTHADGRPTDIVIQLGSDPLDVLFVMLHEMAHAICPPRIDKRGHVAAHTQTFYRTAGELYSVYEIPLSYAIWREAISGHPSAAGVLLETYGVAA